MDAETQSACKRKERVQAEVTVTLRATPYSYLQLSATSIDGRVTRHPLDAITARTYLTSALSQYLGLTGTAIPIDILKVTDQDIWVRVPKEDARAVIAAIGQWANASVGISLKIEGWGDWLGGVVVGGEMRRHNPFSAEG
jgi:ribonuclease P/MRP protein subunit POP8